MPRPRPISYIHGGEIPPAQAKTKVALFWDGVLFCNVKFNLSRMNVHPNLYKNNRGFYPRLNKWSKHIFYKCGILLSASNCHHNIRLFRIPVGKAWDTFRNNIQGKVKFRNRFKKIGQSSHIQIFFLFNVEGSTLRGSFGFPASRAHHGFYLPVIPFVSALLTSLNFCIYYSMGLEKSQYFFM